MTTKNILNNSEKFSSENTMMPSVFTLFKRTVTTVFVCVLMTCLTACRENKNQAALPSGSSSAPAANAQQLGAGVSAANADNAIAPESRQYLARFTDNVNDMVRAYERNRATGRSDLNNNIALDQGYVGNPEIFEEMQDLLGRRNNRAVQLSGASGSGKTAAAYEFARRLVNDDVGSDLKNKIMFRIDIDRLLEPTEPGEAGTVGQEVSSQIVVRRMQQIIQKAAGQILFIDNADALMLPRSSGGAVGPYSSLTGLAMNTLLRAVEEGKTTLITTGSYDFGRRVERVELREPKQEHLAQILMQHARDFETRYGVRIPFDVISAAIRFSSRMGQTGGEGLSNSISFLERAAARVKRRYEQGPRELRVVREKMHLMRIQTALLQRDLSMNTSGGVSAAIGRSELERIMGHTTVVDGVETRVPGELEKLQLSLNEVLANWNSIRGARNNDNNRELIENLTETQDRLRAAQARLNSTLINGQPGNSSDFAEIKTLEQQLRQLGERLAGDQPLVTVEIFQEIVGEHLGRNVGAFGNREELANLEAELNRRVTGQTDVVRLVAQRMQTAGVGLTVDPDRPVGIFAFLGTSGSGKTFLSKQIAATVYGDENAVELMNMGEFSSETSKSRLLGSDPGFIGFGTTETLAEKIARKPYMVLIFDEIEKAHPDVFDAIMGMLDNGYITDGTGRRVSARGVTVVFTSNIGQEIILGAANDPDPAAQTRAREEARREFYRFIHPKTGRPLVRPEVGARIELGGGIGIMNALTHAGARKILQNNNVKTIIESARRDLGIQLSFDDATLDYVTKLSLAKLNSMGGRAVREAFEVHVLSQLAQAVLATERQARIELARLAEEARAAGHSTEGAPRNATVTEIRVSMSSRLDMPTPEELNVILEPLSPEARVAKIAEYKESAHEMHVRVVTDLHPVGGSSDYYVGLAELPTAEQLRRQRELEQVIAARGHAVRGSQDGEGTPLVADPAAPAAVTAAAAPGASGPGECVVAAGGSQSDAIAAEEAVKAAEEAGRAH